MKGRLPMRRIIPGLLMLVWTAAACAAGSLHFGPPQPWVKPVPLPSAGVATQAAVKILLLDYQVDLTARTTRYYIESATRIQTPQGLTAAGTLTIAWNPDTDVVTVHKVRILRGSKVIDVLGGGQTFTIARRETNLDYQSLDDTLTAILQPEGLRVGDTVDIAYTLARTDPILEGSLSAQIAIPPGVPVSRLHVSAQWPAADAVKWRATDGLTGIQPIREHGMSGVTLTMNDVQPVLQPKDAPPRSLVLRRIEFSGLASWSAVAQRLAPLYERAARLQPDSPLRAQIARIEAATPDPARRAALALALVEDQVRYLFLAMNDGGLVPATADQTWSRRYGDCKAKTVLLLALLHGLGIEAQPVAVSVAAGGGLDERLPSIAAFDHVLVEATVAGRTYWLDGTRIGDRSLEFLHVPFYHWGLPLAAPTPGLVRMVPPPLTHPSMQTAISIDASRGVTLPAPFHAELALHGYAAVVLQQRLGNLTPAQLDAGLRTLWSRQFRFVKVHQVAAAYDKTREIERLTLDGTARMQWSGGEYSPPDLTVGYEADFERQPGPHSDAPFAVAYPLYSTTEVTIKLPVGGRGFTVTGADVTRDLAGFEYRRQARIANGVFTASVSARSLQPEFPAAEAAADQKALRALSKSALDLHAPTGHTPSPPQIAWGVPASNSTAAGYSRSGYLLSRHGDYDAAIADYDAALALDARSASTLGDRGMAYAWTGHLARARADFDAALAVDPHEWVALDGRGLLAQRAGDEAGAIAAFSAALRSNPKDDFALQSRAYAYWALGKRGEALADYSAAIRRKPQVAQLYWYRAVLLRQEGRKAPALAQARLVTTANPKSAPAWFVAGSIYASCNERAQASAAYDHAVSLAPDARTYLMRAAFRHWADLSGKRADIERALKLAPTSAVALTMLAQVQMAAGRYAAAASSLTKAIGPAPAGPDTLTLRGIAYERAGETALARADFTRALALAKQAGPLNNICWELATAGLSLDKALDACNAAIAEGPVFPAVLDSRGFVLMRLGHYHQAIASYDAALRLSPLQANSLYGRGICELRVGRILRGRADMRAATELSPRVADEFAHYGVRP